MQRLKTGIGDFVFTQSIKAKDNKLRLDFLVSVTHSNIDGNCCIADFDTGTRFDSRDGFKTKRVSNVGTNLPSWDDIVSMSEQVPAKDTGSSELINGFQAEIFLKATSTFTNKFWVVKNYPNYSQYEREFREIDRRMFLLYHEKPSFAWSDENLPGMVVKSVHVGDCLTNVVELVEIRETKLSDADFEPLETDVPYWVTKRCQPKAWSVL